MKKLVMLLILAGYLSACEVNYVNSSDYPDCTASHQILIYTMERNMTARGGPIRNITSLKTINICDSCPLENDNNQDPCKKLKQEVR